MPLEQTLDEIVTAIRAETGQSTNMAAGRENLPALYQMVNRIQQGYHEDFEWPHLKVNRDQTLSAGERYYTFHEEIDFNRIFEVHVKDGDTWKKLDYGITPDHYNAYDSDAGQTDQCPRRWDIYEGGQFEVWPIPSQATTIRWHAIRALPRLINGTDRPLIDSTLLILSAAAEVAANLKRNDATLKGNQAAARYSRLRGNTSKTKMFVFGGCHHPPRREIRAPRN